MAVDHQPHQAMMIPKGSHQETESLYCLDREMLWGFLHPGLCTASVSSTAFHPNWDWGDKCIKQLPLQHARLPPVPEAGMWHTAVQSCLMHWAGNPALLPPIHFVLSPLSRNKRSMPRVTVCKKGIESCNLTSRTIKGGKKQTKLRRKAKAQIRKSSPGWWPFRHSASF